MKDPIVEEIHKIRERLAEEQNFDLKQILGRIKESEKKHIKDFVRKEDIPKAS